MALNDIYFQKQNGGLGRTAAGEDPISGLLIATGDAISAVDVEAFDNINGICIAKLSFYEQLEQVYGIAPVDVTGLEDAELLTAQALNAVDYHVREFFRLSPEGTLYLGIKIADDIAGNDIVLLQNYTNGALRQVGVLTADDSKVADYQTAATALEDNHKPLSIVYSGNGSGTTLATYTTGATQVFKGRCNVSKVIGCDLDPDLLERLGNFGFWGAVGTLCGAISAAAVNENIGWVAKFPLNFTVPGIISSDRVNEISMQNQLLLNDNRLIYVRTYVGNANNYFNDSHTLDVQTSDYAYIENVRTMDKAIRGIRTNLLPQLNAPLYANPTTGNLAANTVAFLQNLAQRALEYMQTAGELSGYAVEIDPAQNVLATSELEIQIKNVPVGVMRKVLVKIGYTTKL